MVTCYNCGKQVSDETLICPECGALVRRYDTMPNQQQTRQTQYQQQDQQIPYVPLNNPTVPVEGFQFSSGQKVWFWICIIFFGFATVICLMSGLMVRPLLADPEYMNMLMQMIQQMSSMAGMDMSSLLANAEDFRLFMNLVTVQIIFSGIFCLAECALYVILLTSRRRSLVLVLCIASLVIFVVSILFTGIGLITISCLIGSAVTYLILRKHLAYMRK